jgi:soluble lytic murein transglycosylase-like protein
MRLFDYILIIGMGVFGLLLPRTASTDAMPMSYPKSIKEIILEASYVNKVPPEIMLAVCSVESGLNPALVNPDDGDSASWGLGQIKVGTAKKLGFTGHGKDLLNPEVNAYFSAKYMRYQLERYEFSWIRGIKSYNAGTSHTNKPNDYYNQVYKFIKQYDKELDKR